MAGKELFDDLGLVLRLSQHVQQVAAALPTGPAGSGSAPAGGPSRSPSPPRQSSFKVLADLEAVAASDPREDAQFEHQRVALAAGATGLPFHLQGDRELNEGSALARRRALRFSDALRAKIAFLWDVARGDPPTSAGATAGPPALGEDAYMALMLLLFKALRDDFTLELAREQIRCDWDVDSRHGQTLAFEQFFAALFELVDIWTCDVEERTYVRFLELLLRRVTVRVVVFLDGDSLRLALSDNFDEAVVVKAIPLRTIPRFAPLAHVVAPCGVRTIGELASADPAAVERERVDYLARTGAVVSAELQELIAMFRRLAQTFEHADYRLEGDTLRRQHRPPGDDRNQDHNRNNDHHDYKHNDGNRDHDYNHNHNHETRRGRDQGHDGPGSVDLTAAAGPDGVKSMASAVASAVASTASVASPPMGGRPRLNSIHDVSVADPDLVTALKTAFLVEKRVSLERQTDAAAVRAELAKLGVEDALALDEDAAQRQYAALYELLVARDGADLAALARAMLRQIRTALEAHGVAVDDDADAEAALDRFYGSVVAGTGETIVADAQRWVQQTLAAGAAGDFLQRDYHELRPVDEVALLGSQPGDEEFVALVAADDAPADAEAPAGHSAPRASASPIQRKASQLSLGPRAPDRALLAAATEPAAEPVAAEATDGSRSPRRASDQRAGGLEGDGDAAGGRRRGKSGARRRGSRGPSRRGDSEHAAERSGSESSADEAVLSERREPLAEPRGEAAGGRGVQGGVDSSGGGSEAATAGCGRSGSDAGEERPEERDGGPSDALVGLGGDRAGAGRSPPDEAQEPAAPPSDADELPHRRSQVASRASRAGPLETAADTPADGRGLLADADEREREPQGVDFAFAEAAPEPAADSPRPEPPRPAELPPKVPEVVVGGVAGGASAPAVGRYIQLLGLGSVTTVPDEQALLALLASDAGRDTDLVCFDVGGELEAARDKLLALQALVGRRVGLFGGARGSGEAAARLDAVTAECLAAGALFFAALPIDFPLLRERIYGFLEGSARPYALRARKPAGLAASALQSAKRAIGAAGLFALPDAEPARRPSMAASAAVAHAGRGGQRKPTVAVPALLPALGLGSSDHRLSPTAVAAAEEARAPELAPSAPLTPRSLKAHKRSPRLSAALNKLIR